MKNREEFYEQLRPLIIWLGIGELGWIGYWLVASPGMSAGYMTICVVWIVSMIAWSIAIIRIAKKGLLLKYSTWFSNMLGFVFVILFAVILFGSTDIGKSGVLSAASQTTHFQLVLIHTLRLLSIGTIIKYMQGQLPLHFVLFGTIPDLLFAVSAVVIVIADPLGTWGNEFYAAWHHIGIQVFLGAGISMFFSMPSPIRIFRSKPDTAIIFEYPMMLAPNLTVPLFAVAHIYAMCKYM